MSTTNLSEFYDLPKAQIIRIKFRDNPKPVYGWMASKRLNSDYLNQVLNIKQFRDGLGNAQIKLISIHSEDFEEFEVMNTADIKV